MNRNQQKKREENLIIKKVKLSGSLEVHYQERNHAIDDYEDKVYKGKEAPAPDLRESLNILAEQAMQEYGFPINKEDWGAFKTKEAVFDGLKVGCIIVFKHGDGSLIEVKLPPTIDVMAEVVSGCQDEIKAYVSGSKRAQGDLFKDTQVKTNVDIDPEAQAKADELELQTAE